MDLFLVTVMLCVVDDDDVVQIGQGTYSNVYKARDLVTGKIVADEESGFGHIVGN